MIVHDVLAQHLGAWVPHRFVDGTVSISACSYPWVSNRIYAGSRLENHAHVLSDRRGFPFSKLKAERLTFQLTNRWGLITISCTRLI